MRFGIYVADVVEWAKRQPEASFDACFCDPPYGLEFMGKEWDKLGKAHMHIKRAAELHDPVKAAYIKHAVEYVGGFAAQEWHHQWAKEIFRILKPGAFLLSFGGTRTHHRLACAIEDAGFEIRDCVMWLYGSGFPKSRDISKAIDKEAGAERKVIGKATSWNRPESEAGHTARMNASPGEYDVTAPATDAAKQWEGYGTALKPAWEPVIVAMKPLDGTFAENALKHGVAGLNVEGCRIGAEGGMGRVIGQKDELQSDRGWGTRKFEVDDTVRGRWPANVILDEEAGRMLDEQSEPMMHSAGSACGKKFKPGNPHGVAYKHGGQGFRIGDESTGASRFFYCAKASPEERDAGLKEKDAETKKGFNASPREYDQKVHDETLIKNVHPTVKPIDLCRYLTSLMLPPKRKEPRRLVVPFAGSGSEMIGALLAGWDLVVGVEKEEEYVKIARLRIRYWGSIPKQRRLEDLLGG